MTQRKLCVHYCHGLESGPNGYKARSIRDYAEVIAPDQKMSVWNPLRRNSVIRSLLRQPPWSLNISSALLDSLDACVEIQTEALNQKTPDVLVGSSWGGLVATVLLAERLWSGPCILLCPAIWIFERRLPNAQRLKEHGRIGDKLVERLSLLPESTRDQMLLIHGTDDPTIPIQDSITLSVRTGIKLERIPNGTHGLGVIAKDGRLRQYIERVGHLTQLT